MSRKDVQQLGKPPIDIVEEAFHLLRMSPLRILGVYYVGTLPFALGFLYFWADMSRGAFAYSHCANASLGLALLYLWMKCWQAAYACLLKAYVCGDPAPRWTHRRIIRLAAVQTAIQASYFFVMPIAALVLLPFGWAYAFYHSVSVVGDGETASTMTVLRKSVRQAGLWTRQNHILILILFAFGLFVFLNVCATLFLVPRLVKTFLGVETVFTRSGFHMLNTTFLAAACAVTYLCVNPLTRAVYVLRCFYGESLHTGADLRAELRVISARSRTVVAGLALLLTLCSVGFLAHSEPAVSGDLQSRPSVSSLELDRAISGVIQQPEFAWRMPREKLSREEIAKGPLTGFIDAVGRTLLRWYSRLKDWVRRIADRIADWLAKRGQNPGPRAQGEGWMTPVRGLGIALMALAAGALITIVAKTLRARGAGGVEVVGEAISPTPSLEDESLTADELPTDTWLSIAREMLEKGELRLALRASYLASLAHLAQHELITIAKFKSNREYERELHRRARALPKLTSAFAHNVTDFERAWYGMHSVTQDILTGFTENLERIRACVGS
jgi:hypothetical protein